ncbi:MAG: hypothetical protein ACR2G6_05205 [Gemmatimonadaceae bacterium]
MARLLNDRGPLLDRVHEAERLPALWLWLMAVMAICAGTYGAVFGMWHGTRLAFYVAVKFPLVLMVTAGLTMIINWILAAAVGIPLRFLQVAVLTFLTLAIASVILVSLAPIAWLFTLSAPEPSRDARTAHNLLYLLHTAFVGAGGAVGSRVLWTALARVAPDRRVAATVYALWMLSFAFVGGEVAWALRPFVGSVYYPIVFLRPDALDGNVYEFIGTQILPYLLSNE